MKSLFGTLPLLALLCGLVLVSCEKQKLELTTETPLFAELDTDLELGFDEPAVAAIVSSCEIGPNDHLCKTKALYAGQDEKVGTVKVYCVIGTNDYKIVYNITSPGCYITEYHLFAGKEKDIPKTQLGNPKIGHFPYAEEGISAETVCVYLEDLPDTFTVAAHAVVSCSGKDAPYEGEETVWADGKGFPGKSWATCFSVDCKGK